ncbi:MAG: alpha-glucan family phosphorylase [Acidobacteriota bacterium]
MKVEIPRLDYLPSRISRLGELSYNLWWSWHAHARELFRNLEHTLWRTTQHNPVKVLREIPTEVLTNRANDPDFLLLYDSVLKGFDEYMLAEETWYAKGYSGDPNAPIAYLCAEFAVHSSLAIYSGGLGLLAGDTCKEASDLGIPFVAVGSLYPEGYFTQLIHADGRQDSVYKRLDTNLAPILPMLNENGRRLLVQVPVGDRKISVAIWKIQVGRVPIFLMDTDIPENEPWDRDLSARLYGGDQLVRLRQEIILGAGGIKVLRALGYRPSIFHLNEGHAAFASFELLREFIKQGSGFDDALERTRSQLVFTTHTPVKAGHDEFPFHLMEEYFQNLWEELGISREQLLKLGQTPEGNSFSMTILALHISRRANGVSKRHGEVSREMWHFLYPSEPLEEVPITSITNGVHVPTWIALELVEHFNEYLGSNWLQHHDDPAVWEKISNMPVEELWRVHVHLKSKMLSFIRERARNRWVKDGVSPGQIVALGSLLDPEALTLGFARRFATYKRATLILRDLERLKGLLRDRWKPVQVVFAGKAHPADEPGKFLIERVFEACSSHELGGRMAFIEDYDKHVAQHLVQGVDVWLNNPEPPKEASGTSGQKASLNGIPNCSVLDGWWYEGYNGKNGWALHGHDDHSTAENLYDTIEYQIVPLFYNRDAQGIPVGWVNMMKEAIRSSAAAFSTRRMIKEYCNRMYNCAD